MVIETNQQLISRVPKWTSFERHGATLFLYTLLPNVGPDYSKSSDFVGLASTF